MTMKTILVPLEESDGLVSMLETAAHVAARFGSYVEGMYVQPALTEVVAAGAEGLGVSTPNLLQTFEQEDRERTERVYQVFQNMVQAKGLAPASDAPVKTETPSARWLERTSPSDIAIGSHGRIFDLIVVGRPVQGKPTPAMSTLEAALFDSGRPLIIAPPSPPSSVGNVCVIAWNGSEETARAIAFATPFLNRAKKVHVLTIEGATVAGPSGQEVADMLCRNGLDATASTRIGDRRTGGAATLEEAQALGCDLLIKGAYTASRVRQMIFGGTTSHIFANAEIPVFTCE